jgi:hypothetical protein
LNNRGVAGKRFDMNAEKVLNYCKALVASN